MPMPESAMPFSGSTGLRRIALWKWSIATSGRLACALTQPPPV